MGAHGNCLSGEGDFGDSYCGPGVQSDYVSVEAVSRPQKGLLTWVLSVRTECSLSDSSPTSEM